MTGCFPEGALPTPLEWLLATQERGVQPGLDRMRNLLRALGNPEQGLRCLHVAGTNGKGSVCAFAESVLRADGYHTGLFTSPHLVSFDERIRIDGLPVGSGDLDDGIRRLQQATRDCNDGGLPTFFELVTALGLDLFARAGCDVVILETGMGGRLDATNLAPKIACAITPIALDHTEWLGETLGEIAREKAGIFLPGIPAILAPQELEALECLHAVARERSTPYISVTEPLAPASLGLAGPHQGWNAAVAVSLLDAGGLKPSREAIRAGLAAVSWPGRFQRLYGGRLVLDGAHNAHAVRQLVTTWRSAYGAQRCRLVFGALADKDPLALLSELEVIAEEVLLVPVASPRSVNPADLARNGCPLVPWRVLGSLKEALNEILDFEGSSDAPHGTPVLVAGSLFLVGEALALHAGTGVAARSQ